MTKTLALSLLLAGLALAGPVLPSAAHAAQIGTTTYGHGNRVQADAFGNADADLTVAGEGNDVDFFAGPCVGDGHSRTVVRGTGQRRVLVAPCP